MDSPKPGQVLAGRYTLERELGHEDSWLARDVDDTLWVVKLVSCPALPERFFHPSVPHPEIHDGFQTRPWFPEVADDGGDLASARRLTEALAALHGAGAVHGNIKPGNILLRNDATPLLVDPVGQGKPDADVRALAAAMAAWAWPEQAVPRVLGEAAAGQLDARSLHDALDDIAVGRQVARDDAAHATVVEGSAEREESHGRWIGRAAVGAALVVALTVLGYVLFALDGGETPTPAPAPERPSEEVAQPEPPQPPPTAEELEAMLEARATAQNVLDEAINLRLDLKERHVEQWAPDAFADANVPLEEGDALFREQDFSAAAARYEDGLERLREIETQGQEMLESAIATGNAALVAGDTAVAQSSFKRAALVAPEDERVVSGLKRAATLDQALALRRDAFAAEEGGRLADALALFRQLQELDPELAGGAEGITRVTGAMADRDFRAAMSEGLAAMRIGDLAEARAHLQRAQRMRPSDPAPAEQLQEVARLDREFEIESHRVKAEQAMAREEWDLALGHYDACLRRDPNLAFALEGRERAAYRLELERRITGLLEDQPTWWSDQGRRTVRATLSEAREVAEATSSPRLAGMVTALDHALEQASKPLSVTLRSDNACNVVVYKVARLGSFDRTAIELKPGHYTAVGTRDGYRDVRRQFTVPAGGPPPEVALVCEDAV